MSLDAARDGVLGYVVCLAGHGNFYCLSAYDSSHAPRPDRLVLSCLVLSSDKKRAVWRDGSSNECNVVFGWLALAAVQTDTLGYFDCVHIRGLSWNENVVQRRSCGQ